MKSTVFSTAWEYIKNGLFTSFSEALRFAWAKVKLLAKLKKGVVSFQFIKKTDNTTRTAKGTLSSDLFSYESKGSDRKKTGTMVTFWDVENNGFRSFDITNFIQYI